MTIGLLQKAIQNLTDTHLSKAVFDEKVGKAQKTLSDLEAALRGDIDRIAAQVEELLGRVQSVVFVPAFEDGKMTVNGTGSVVNTFKIMPADALSSADQAKIYAAALVICAKKGGTAISSPFYNICF